MLTFGIDSSNYRSSAAAINEKGKFVSSRKLLPVDLGQCGLRQSDAVFLHTKQLPDIVGEVLSNINTADILAVGVSDRPRRVERSYMPCFLVGMGLAKSVSAALDKPLFYFSHQEGHIAAALLSSNRLDLFDKKFIAFHISGGTTEAVLVKPGKIGFETEIIAKTLDISVGQVIDRVGVMLGLEFPAGEQLERLAENGSSLKKITPALKGYNPALSGVQNFSKDLLEKGADSEDIAFTALEYVSLTLTEMVKKIKKEYADLPLVFSGGVMANKKLKNDILKVTDADFASPELSGDNAVGTAYLSLRQLEK